MVMLKAMRKRTRMILWGTIILVIPAFILAGALVGLRERGINLVASVNGKGITREAYYREVRRLYRGMRERMGDNFDEEMAKVLNLEGTALNSLIERELLFQETKRKKIRVNDQELIKAIKDYQEGGKYIFQRGGKFDRQLYLDLLAWNNISPHDFEKEMLKEISITKLRNMVLDKVKISEEEIKDAYLKENEEIEMEYLLLKPAKEIKIEEKEIEDYYQKNKESYRMPEKIRVKHILIKMAGPEEKKEARERIRKISRKLKEGEDFESLAKEFSQCPSKERGGDLGFIKKGDTIPEFERVAFGLEKGQISRPVRSRFGYHIIKLEEQKESYIPPLDEVREKIKKILEKERGWERARKKAQEIAQGIEKEDLGVLAKRFSLGVKGTDLFKRRESNLPRQIEEEAFGLKVGEAKGPLRGGNGYYIIKVIKRKGIDEERFAEEKEVFTKDFIQKKKALVYNQWYQDLYQKAKIKIYSLER